MIEELVVTMDDIEECAKMGYWGNPQSTPLIIALNIVSIADSGRKSEVSSYMKNKLGQCCYTPRSSSNPAYHFAGVYSDLVKIVSYITKLNIEIVDRCLYKFSYRTSHFIQAKHFKGLPREHQKVFSAGSGLPMDNNDHKFMWDYNSRNNLYCCTQDSLKFRMILWLNS